VNELRIELPPEVPVEEARLLLAAKLYETGRLSLGQAAELARHSVAAFIEIVGKIGRPAVDFPRAQIEDERTRVSSGFRVMGAQPVNDRLNAAVRSLATILNGEELRYLADRLERRTAAGNRAGPRGEAP
jgi:hypothetical protein